MRKIYFIRHSQPEFPEGKKMCIGTTDLFLGHIGKMQSVLLAEGLKDKEISKVYCSNLKRSVETALFLTDIPEQMAEFREFDCGEWEGLTFEEIKERWPEVYRMRGEDLSYPIPGAEDLKEAGERFEQGLKRALAESTGNIAVVGHATSLKVFLCGLLGIDVKMYRTIPLDYAAVTTLCYEKELFIESQNQRFLPELTEVICRKLLDAAETPEHVQNHCFAVCEQAKRICDELSQVGIVLNRERICLGALLHDIARTEKKHAPIGGEWVTKAGYPEYGALIASHHEVESLTGELNERAVLAMADCSVQETEIVSIEQRFEKSREKCKTEDALNMHEMRYKAAKDLRERVNIICGKEIFL